MERKQRSRGTAPQSVEREPAAQREAAPRRPASTGHPALVNSPRVAAQRQQVQRLFGPAAPWQPQGKAGAVPMSTAAPVQRAEELAPGPNRTGLPDNLKSGVESLSGLSLDHVRVHYGSAQPAQLNALAYAQGSDIHVAPGQEKHLPHEAWHVVQQMQGRVKPTMQMKEGTPVNDDAGLEQEADAMGAKALAAGRGQILPAVGGPAQLSAAGPASLAGTETLQLYQVVRATGGQGGSYVYGNKQVHLHIGIGSKTHVKIEGNSINIATSGGKLDTGKMSDAIQRLLDFKEKIKNDLTRARNYAQPIQDCIDWLLENGASMPVQASPSTSTVVVEEEKKEEEKASGEYDSSFFANMNSSNKNNSGAEEDFM